MHLTFVLYDRADYHSGPIVNARRLLPELMRRGHDVSALVFTADGTTPNADRLAAEGVTCRTVGWRGGCTEDHIVWILAQLRDLKPDVFVPNISTAGYFAARWARESGIATIAAHRSDDAYHWAMVDQFVTGEKAWAVSGLVCVSRDLCTRVAARAPQHTRLCVIPSGVPIPERVSSQGGPLRIAYAGRLVQEQKRIIDLVDALISVLRVIPNATATLMGDGPEREALERKVNAARLTQRIRFAGSVPVTEIHDELAKHDVLVLLSDYEGTPGAVMDGMASGLVPVCLDMGVGLDELVQHEKTGLIVRDRNADFVNAMRLLAGDAALRKRFGAAARQHVIDNFSLSTAAIAWERFCADLCASAGPRQQLIAPRRLDLPPVRKGLDREDHRRLGPRAVLVHRTKRLLRRVRSVLGTT